MSCYIVDTKHLVYLVQAARAASMGRSGDFRWKTPTGERRELRMDSGARDLVGAANMLLAENERSYYARYPKCTAGASAPVTTNDFVLYTWDGMRPVDVFKACDCFEYQACETEDWPKSEAYSFLDSMRAAYMRRLPGYEDAEWGAPATRRELQAARPVPPAPRLQLVR